PPQVIDLQSLPESLIQVPQPLQFLDGKVEGLADLCRRAARRLARRGVNDLQGRVPQFFDRPANLFLPPLVERQVKRPLNTILFVEIRTTRSYQDDCRHRIRVSLLRG